MSFIRQEIAVEVRKKARNYVDSAFKTIVKIMGDDTVSADTRLKAARVLIERAAGKPSQEVFLEGTDNDDYEEQFAKASAETDALLQLPPPREQPLQEVLPPLKDTANVTAFPRRKRKA